MKVRRYLVLFCTVLALNHVVLAAETPAKTPDIFTPAFNALKKSDDVYKADLSKAELAKRERENVGANREALAELRLLLENWPQGFPALRHDVPAEADRAVVINSNLREFARLLTRESTVRLADGDAAGAMQSRLDCYQLGVNLSRNGRVIDGLVSVAIVALAWNDIEKVGSRLDGKSCLDIFNRIEEVRRKNAGYAEVLEKERDFVLPEVRKQYKDVKIDPVIINQAFEAGEITLQEKEQILTFSPEKMESNLVTAFNKLIDGARKPFSSLEAAVKVDDGYSQSIISNVAGTSTRFNFERGESRTRLIQAALLLRAHKLGELSEAEFDKLMPRDPFSPNQLIVKDSIVYSVGPDGEDDGGEPFKNVWRGIEPETGMRTQANSKAIQYDSVGDIIGPDFIMPQP